MNPIRQIAKSVLTTLCGHERLLVRGPRTRTSPPKIALTFDDGPDPEHTPRLLDLLDAFSLQATFFVIGQKAEKYPELIRRMVKAGHEIANHTYSHSEPCDTPAAKFLDEVRQTDELLSNLTGELARSVRPPKGELNLSKLRGLWRCGKTVALWNVDPKDFRMRDDDEMKAWCNSYQPHDGDIVLLHDNHPYANCAIELMSARGIFKQFETTTLKQWLS